MPVARLVDPPSVSHLHAKIALLQATVDRLLAAQHVWQREYGVRRYHCRRCRAQCSDPRLVGATCSEMAGLYEGGRVTNARPPGSR